MKKRVSGIILAGIILLSGAFSFAENADKGTAVKGAYFSDIKNHWSYPAVEGLIKKDAIPFTSEGNKFVPGKAIAKSEFVVMLHKALGININYLVAPDITKHFNDVKQDAPYANALIDLVTTNIMEGGYGSFGPDDIITREQMVHYIMNAYQFMMGEKYAMIKIPPASFKDIDAAAAEFSGDIARAQHYKLVSGVGNGLFLPKANASRAEAAMVIYRLTELLEQQRLEIQIKPEAIVSEDAIEMKVSIINNSSEDVTINHSSGYKYDFELLDADKNGLYMWSADKSFIAMLTSTKIEAGETVVFSETLSGDIFEEIKDKIVYMKAYIIGDSDKFTINNELYEIRLK